jgi:peptidoglycan/xylan/chitin deacetylase (PgdA/CDA1 family)
MKKVMCLSAAFILIVSTTTSNAQEGARLRLHYTLSGGLAVVIPAGIHQQYGFAIPVTYKIGIPPGSGNLVAYERYSSADAWAVIPTKTDTDSFNDIQTVRFDYVNNIAYASAAFSPNSDTLFLNFTDQSGTTITPAFEGISKYYDNRRAVVTVTADDWSDWVVTDGRFTTLLDLFRSYGLYTTVGVITQDCSDQTWHALQMQVNSGKVEVASHSRTHPNTPYKDPSGEVAGSRSDILNSVTLAPPFRSGNSEYVYTWIAPYGDYDSTVDSLLGTSGYLDARLYANLDTTSPRIYVYGDSTLAAWDESRSHFAAFLPTVELGAPSWGGGDTSLASLNNLFDTVAAKGDVYHLMWHPQVIFDDRGKSYLTGHLSHISGHRDIWYANLGVVYLYHMLQVENASPLDAIAGVKGTPGSFALQQNYPNPFNPTTTIPYRLSAAAHIELDVYDVLGRKVKTLIEGRQSQGEHFVTFDGSGLSSGVYFYRILSTADNGEKFVAVRKLVYMK